eukprot:TRINITY_DN16_c2_g1_i1.p1 TRINITY_DN16_c2_g1~~TRINITY_DN16_c2_g1_i1.p1  ORF type:complete len:366 (+),score=173.67 TRINITY_DN16_c2_g1_i1:45-1142(+)
MAENSLNYEKPLLLKACFGEKTEIVPVWIMRQAGRYLPEFRETRKQGGDFFKCCQTPEIAAELTLQPLRRFNLDAAIIFSDILVVPQALGMQVIMVESKGPTFPDPLSEPSDSRFLEMIEKQVNVQLSLGYVFEALKLVRQQLDSSKALIGFSGGPWTLMAYMIEGGGSKTWHNAKRWLYQYPNQSHQLLTKLTQIIIDYLEAQAIAGAQILQVFETWAGELAPDMFDQFLLPYLFQIANELKQRVPNIALIVFPKGTLYYSLEKLISNESKYDVIGLDWTVDLTWVKNTVAGKKTVQGNLDPVVLAAEPAVIQKQVERMIKQFGTQKLIANLGHGLQPWHNFEHVECFIESVHQISKQINQNSL